MRPFKLVVVVSIWSVLSACASADGVGDAPDTLGRSTENWVTTIARWISPSVRELEEGQRSRLARLHSLPEYTLKSHLRAGFHSGFVPIKGPPEWVQVDLGREYAIDTIAIVPSLVSIGGAEVERYGFPKRLLLQISSTADFSDIQMHEEFVRNDQAGLDLFPVICHTKKVRGRYVRITSLEHAEQDGMGYFALGELIVLSGELNVAAWRPVSASSRVNTVLRWAPEYLVDQFSMLPPATGTTTNTSRGFLSGPGPGQYQHKWILLDLKREYAIDEVRIYPAQSKDNTHVPGWGFPLSFRIELCNDSTFINYERIADFSNMQLRHWAESPLFFPVASRSAFNGRRVGNGINPNPDDLKMQSILTRYVRVYANRLDSRITPAFMALDEIQVFAEGKNIAFNADVIVSDRAGPEYGDFWAPEFVVDGVARQRQLIGLSQWLNYIEQRESLEADVDESYYQLEQSRHRVVNVAGSTLGIGLLGTISSLLFVNWRQRRTLRKETEILRSQMASDLHDDIGSNLGTIALISEMLEANQDLSQATKADLREIQSIAMETSGAMRDIIWILQPSMVGLTDFVVRLRDVATRMLPGCQLEFASNGCRSSASLGIRWRRNVFLAFKEVVHNIAKHSQAQCVSIQVERTGDRLILRIDDDGVGFEAISRTQAMVLIMCENACAIWEVMLSIRAITELELSWKYHFRQ